MHGSRSGLAGAVAALALAAQAALVLWFAAGPILTDDLWWHLAMGEVYAREGPWPEGGDPLLHTAHEDAPVQHEWLFGVVVHGIEQVAGFHGLRAAHGLTVLAIVLLVLSLFRRAAGSLVTACLATAIFLALSWWRLLQLRPDLASIAATLVLYRLLLERGVVPGRGRVAAAVLLLGVWANLHSLFAIGPLLLVAALSGLAAHAILARVAAEPADAAGRARALGAALGLGLLATLLNPRGPAQHLTFFTSTAETGIWRVVDEWMPFSPLSPAGYLQGVTLLSWVLTDAVLVLLAIGAVLAFVRFLRAPSPEALRRLDPMGLALAAAGVVALLVSIRFLWMGVLPLLYLLRLGRTLPAPAAASWIGAAACAALAVAFFRGDFRSVAPVLPETPGAWLAEPFVRDKYQLAGVRFLRETGLEGRLYNKYAMGGFLGYWLGPRLRTYVDSRTEHYPAEVLEEYSAVGSRQGRRPGEDFRDVLERRGVDIFFGAGFPRPADRDGLLETSDHLADDPDWILVSRSVTHAIHLRRGAQSRENLRRVAAWYAREGVPFDPERGLDVVAVVETQPSWAARWAMLPRQGEALLAATRSPDEPERLRALDALGRTLALLGAHERQIQLNRAALELAPRAPAPRRRVIYGLLRLGRGVEAQRELRRLLQVAPGDLLTAGAAAATEAFLRALSAELEHPRAPRTGSPAEAMLDRFPLLSAEETAWLRSAFEPVKLDEGAGPVGENPGTLASTPFRGERAG